MGKGNRNRESRGFDRVDAPQKNKQRKPMPKWMKTAISLVLVAAILCGIVLLILSGNGTFERNRILVESKTGKYDVNQQMATYIAWYNLYQNGVWMYNLYAQMGTNLSYSADQMGLSYAMELKNDLRSGISGVQDQLVEYVALCDAADAAGITLNSEDQENINSTIKALWALKSMVGYDSVSRNVFLEDFMAPGMREEDIRSALELMILANKYALHLQTNLEASLVTDTSGILLKYRDANLNKFYTAKYLSYTADTPDLVKELEKATSAEQFKEIVLLDYFNTNYKGIFNKYTTQLDVDKDYKSIAEKEDKPGSTVWSDAIAQIENFTKDTYTKDSTNLPQAVKDWLFDESRAVCDSNRLSIDNQEYVITIASLTRDDDLNTTSAEAYVKVFDASAMAEADALYNAIAEKRDIPAGTAWSDAIAAIGGMNLVTYHKKTCTLPEKVKTALFEKELKPYQTFYEEADGKYYLISVKSYNKGTEADDITVEVYIKEYEMVEGTSYQGDDTFKTTMYNYLKYYLIDKENDTDGKNKPSVVYKTASEKAEALKDELKKENANVEEILKAVAGLVTVSAQNPPASIPSVVTSAFKDTTKKGDVLIANEEKSGVYYLIYVDTDKTDEVGYGYRYAKFETDLFHTMETEMQNAASKIVPAQKTANADTEAAVDTFAGWISELTASGDSKVLPFIRVKNEAKMFTETTKEETTKSDGNKEETEKTVYSAYFIVDTMNYDAETVKIHGGYLKFTGSSAQADAEASIAKLTGKTYADLVAAFYSQGATTSYNAGFDVTSINDETVKAWFKAEGRVHNEIAIIDGKDGNKYVVVFVEKLIGWESDVKTTYVTETCKAQVADLTTGYVFNTEKLEKIPTTEVAQTTSAAA